MKPIASVAALAACVLALPALAADGKTVYGQTCAACHASGLAGAPKVGDKAAWASRTAGGKGGLVASVVKGKGAMPPKAGNASLTEEEIGAAIDYMLGQIK
jgi:cytochrome c5